MGGTSWQTMDQGVNSCASVDEEAGEVVETEAGG